MASGTRALVINTQERAVSTDINRLQSFAARDQAEAMRQLLDVVTDDLDPGFTTTPTSVSASSGAEILGGYMVRPAVASLDLAVDGGVAYLVAPDGGFDDSNYKYLRDAGISTPGALVMSPNASGSVRIDVVECQADPVPSVVTDNRDIFDPSTGLFTASVITKETQFRMAYRVRQGTPGAGFPGTVGGWLPLAVAHVPNGAVDNDAMTFWDVRPLVADRVQPSSVGSLGFPRLERLDARHERVSASSLLVSGVFRAQLNGRWLGGQFRRGTPGADAASIDVADAANQDSAITEPLTGHVYVYAMTPFGLPRWARYADAPSPRLPRTTKGMLVASYVVPDLFGSPSSTLPFPAGCGLVGTTGEAVCVGVVPKAESLFFSAGFAVNKTYLPSGPLGLLVSSSNIGGFYQFDVDDTFWPPNAREMLVLFSAINTLPAATIESVAISRANVYSAATATGPNSVVWAPAIPYSNATGAPVAFVVEQKDWLPIPLTYPTAPGATRRVTWAHGVTAGTMGATASMRIYGFRY